MVLKAARFFILAFLLLSVSAHSAAADRVLKLPFQYGSDRTSILLTGSINGQPVMLAFDTGSPKTVLHSEVRGLHSGPAQEVLLELGGWQWKRWRVVVKELEQNYSAAHERIDGVLGLDFLGQFSQITINLKDKTITLVGESAPDAHSIILFNDRNTLSFGNLGKLTLEGGEGRYRLNGTALQRIDAGPVDLSTPSGEYRVKATFLKTVLISKSQPLESSNQRLLQSWAQEIPLVANILKDHDAIGSMKPVVYDLVEPHDQHDLQLQEELVLLWSADPLESANIGETSLLPPQAFPGQLVDVQYRGLREPAKTLIGKIILQILYIRDQVRPAMVGSFLIVSKPSGEFEFYLVPRSVLDQIVVDQPK